jgi:selenocysteine-specific translation elongation factor
LKDGALVRIHHGSGNFPARVLFVEGGELTPGRGLCAQLRFRSPFSAFAGDRFIVRDWSEQTTLGGGMVLDSGRQS